MVNNDKINSLNISHGFFLVKDMVLRQNLAYISLV